MPDVYFIIFLEGKLSSRETSVWRRPGNCWSGPRPTRRRLRGSMRRLVVGSWVLVDLTLGLGFR